MNIPNDFPKPMTYRRNNIFIPYEGNGLKGRLRILRANRGFSRILWIISILFFILISIPISASISILGAGIGSFLGLIIGLIISVAVGSTKYLGIITTICLVIGAVTSFIVGMYMMLEEFLYDI